MLNAVLGQMNNFGRIPVCGMISGYNGEKADGFSNAMNIIGKRLLLQGFIISDHFVEMEEEFYRVMGGWVKEGKIVYREDVSVGLESLPKTLIGVLTGKNFGKSVVKV